jgi:hypothetical protein
MNTVTFAHLDAAMRIVREPESALAPEESDEAAPEAGSVQATGPTARLLLSGPAAPPRATSGKG